MDNRKKLAQQRGERLEKVRASGEWPHCPCGSKLSELDIKRGDAVCCHCEMAALNEQIDRLYGQSLDRNSDTINAVDYLLTGVIAAVVVIILVTVVQIAFR